MPARAADKCITMYVANTHLKPVIGIDIHFVNLPFPFVPMPHPYIGLVIDPFDYIPFIGATVKVNGVPRGNTNTMGMIITFLHIPFGLGFTIFPIIGHDSQNFFGSKNVMVDGAPFSGAGYMLMTCNDIGLPLSFRPGRKFIPIPSLYLPTSYCVPLQWGPPVNVGGPLVPNFSLMALLKAFVFGSFLKVLGKAAKGITKKLKSSKAVKSSQASKKNPAIKSKKCGDPVDVVSGRVTYEYIDFEIPGPIPLSWMRVWDSDSSLTGSLGHGCHLNFERRITLFEEEGVLMLLLADGRETVMPSLFPGEEYYDPSEKIVLKRKQNGHFILTDYKESLYFHFNHELHSGVFYLSFIENQSGYRIQMHYTGTQFTGITDSAGRRLIFEMHQNTYITKVEVLHKNVRQTLVQYNYNDAGDMIAVTDAISQTTHLNYKNHLLVKRTDRNGMSFYWEYDNQHRCIHSFGDNGMLEYHLQFNKGYTIITNSLGEQTSYHYNENNLIVQETDHYGHSRYTEYTADSEIHREIDELGNITGYVYDDKERLKEKIFPDGSNIQYQYDDHHKLQLIIYPDGSSETYGYDEQRRLRFINYPGGNTLSYQYNTDGRLIAMIENGQQKTLFEYDDDENLSIAVLPNGAHLQWKYDALGKCIKAINAGDQVRYFDYDLLGRVSNMYLADGNTVQLQYNAYEEVVAARDKFNYIQFEYTPSGNLKKRIQNNTEVQFLYDTEERLHAVINEAGNYYRFGYNKRGEIISETGFDGSQRTYTRDVAGKVIRALRPENRYTGYEYDTNGRIIRIEYHDNSWELFRYDKNGKLIEASNENNTVQFIRNPSGFVTSELQDGYAVNSCYDKYGNRSSINSSLGADIKLKRNELGLVTDLRADQTSFFPGTSKKTWQSQYKYNPAGQETERHLPGGIKSIYSYSQEGRPAEHKVSKDTVLQSWKKYTWDANDRLTEIFNSLSRTNTRFKHNLTGNLVFAQYADSNMILDKSTDDTGNLYETKEKKDRTYNAAGALLESSKYCYRYDEEGNLTSKTEKISQKKICYEWYANGMLKKMIRPDEKEICFKYDALGRRTEKSVPGKFQETDSVIRFVWDGNVLLHEWSYPEKERPQAVVDEYGTIRYSKTEPLNNLCTWIFEADNFTPTAKICDGKTYSIITDYLGTPSMMFDEEGNKVWEAVLDIYGSVRMIAGEKKSLPFRYQGQYEDEETGLYYNRFRYYSAGEGMYISQDPIRLNGGLSLYAYVPDNNFLVDVFGLNPVFDDKLGQDARSVHDVLGNGTRAHRNSTVSIAEGKLPNGQSQLFASGNNATLSPLQKAKLIEQGVPKENIYSGAKFREVVEGDKNASNLLNHAERVIIRNAPPGTKFTKWGVSWGGQQRNASCKNCIPHVECAS